MKLPNEYVREINDLTVAEIISRIAAWFERAKAGTTVEELTPDVTRLCNHIPFETLRVHGDVKFFRGRTASNGTYFSNTSQMWHPPAAYVKSLGRANQIGSPMFYAAQDGRTAIFEMSLHPNQHVAIAEIGIREGMSLNLQHVGVFNNLTSGNLGDIASQFSKRLFDRGYTINGINNITLIHRLLGEQFMRDVTPGNEHEYGVSVAIANFYLSYADSDGLMFPSKRSPNDFNIAIKPSSADAKLLIKRVYGLQAIDTSSSDVSFRYWNASTNISEASGEIEWTVGMELPPLNWNSSGYPALRGPYKTSFPVGTATAT